jgi:aspartyl-tRNA(Asn)/glutamyl-tRNA(Gln) amidotransferase subunit C
MACLPCRNCYAGSKIRRNRFRAAPAQIHFIQTRAGVSRTNTNMKVTEKDVAYVADLANLELTEAERRRLLRDLNSILDYIDRLNQLDTTGVQPMAQVSDNYGVDQPEAGSRRLISGGREDILEGLRKSLPHDVALQNAPDSDGTFFKVPKVIER